MPTRNRIVWLSIGIALVLLVAVAFLSAPAHEVHTPGATSLKASVVDTDIHVYKVIQPSQSLAEVRCQVWAALHNMQPCPGDIARTYLASITQAPDSLYMLWAGCISWHGSGAIINWKGYNVEYVPSGRKLVIHCYVAEPWITHHQTLSGVLAIPSVPLLIVPTRVMGPGTIQIVEDDRLEHLVGDQSDEFQLATATIS